MISVYQVSSEVLRRTRAPTCLCSPGEMSNRSRSSAKRASRAQKQSGLLGSFTRGERKTAIIDEDEPTVIDLDDDDPVSENGQIRFSKLSCLCVCVFYCLCLCVEFQ